jgi:mannan endo-1,4-beta-mannosidase
VAASVAAVAAVTLYGHAIIRHAAGPPPVRSRAAVASLSADAHLYLGAYEPTSPRSWAGMATFGASTKTSPDIALYYSGWWEPFRISFAKTAAGHGAIPLVQIDPAGASLRAIAAGTDDSYLKAYARSVAAYRKPVIIGFGHEMNGGWYSWGYGHTPAGTWVKAWRHIVTVFRKTGARNVTWLWTVSHSFTQRYRAYWPGSKYVTWVGIDGYLAAPNQTYATVFGQAVKSIRKITSKPILLSEAAVGPKTGHQAAGIKGLFAGIRRDHLIGLVWFDAMATQNWRIEGHAAALKAFGQGAHSLGIK